MTSQQLLLGGGGPSMVDGINLKFVGKHGSSADQGSSLSGYWGAASQNHYNVPINNVFGQSNFTLVGSGILKFSVPNGSYKIYAKSGDGCGRQHWPGMSTEATLTLSNTTNNLMVLIPNHGIGMYSGGGGFFLIEGTDHTSTSNTGILILGGGGGGYNAEQTFGQAGPLSTSTAQNPSRRGPDKARTGNYDEGACWKNDYTPYTYPGSGTTNGRARHFIEGGQGGSAGPCGPNYYGGFGGGGGGCPGGGGGLQGGYSGTEGSQNPGFGGNHPDGASYATGGGGGTSYYNASYISALTNTNYGSQTGTTPSSHLSEVTSMNGYFGIHGPN